MQININSKHLQNTNNFIEKSHLLSHHDLAFEFMLNNLRLEQGFNEALFTSRTNLELEFLADKIDLARRKGLLCTSNNIIKPSDTGKKFLNDLCEIFL